MSNRILYYNREYYYKQRRASLTGVGGRCLGGSSAINGLYYGRGTSTIYDKWEALGNPGWSWNDVHPLFVKVSFPSPSLTAFLSGDLLTAALHC